MRSSRTNCVIFDGCNKLFPMLESGLKLSKDKKECYRQVLSCESENDLIVENIIEPLKGQFRVRLFVEFELNKQIRRHPHFLLELDYATKRAEVLSFESNLYPTVRLDAYMVRNGKKHYNVVAQKDLRTLCEVWIKQLNELNYRPKWQVKQQTA